MKPLSWLGLAVSPLLAGLVKAVPHTHSHSHLHRRADCNTAKVVAGDGCASLATKCGITAAQFTTYNPSSTLCSSLAVGQYVCCSSGTLPDLTPKPNADGSCKTYTVVQGDSCSVISAANSLTNAQLETLNKNTWGWTGCDNLGVGVVMCLSSGTAPFPASVAGTVCGPQVPGTIAPASGVNISEMNPCPLNACCDIWGQCGTDDEFCTISKSASGAPGTAAKGQYGCISNCGTEIVKGSAPSSFISIGYFEAFNFNRNCLNMDVTAIDTTKYTHVHFAFAQVTTAFGVDLGPQEQVYQFDKFKAMTGIKKIVSFGGWSFSTEAGTSPIFRDGVSAANRATFIANLVTFVNDNQLDGIDFDWEYPGAIDIPGITGASINDGTNYLAFLQDLKNALPSGITLSIAAPASFWYLKGFPIKDMAAVVDYIVYMTYDLHGQWDYANEFSNPGCPDGNCLRSHVNVTETILALSMITKAGVPSNKIITGVSSYGRSFKMTTAGCTGPMCTFTGPDSGAMPGRCTATAGYISNSEIKEIIATNPSAQTFIDGTWSNILVYNDTEWVAYLDDDAKITRTNLYKAYNMGGTVDWAIDLDASLDGSSDTDTPGDDTFPFGAKNSGSSQSKRRDLEYKAYIPHSTQYIKGSNGLSDANQRDWCENVQDAKAENYPKLDNRPTFDMSWMTTSCSIDEVVNTGFTYTASQRWAAVQASYAFQQFHVCWLDPTTDVRYPALHQHSFSLGVFNYFMGPDETHCEEFGRGCDATTQCTESGHPAGYVFVFFLSTEQH
jgi:chitinase